MIAFVEGELVEKQATQIIISVGGIGFEIHIPMSTYQALGAVRSRARVETFFHVRDDGMQLYGFATLEEKKMFELLIGLSGIGPTLALGILSGTTVAEFTIAILTEDIKKLSSIPKVGRKTAQRLIMELRDIMTRAGAGTQTILPIASSSEGQSAIDDAILALVALGYDPAQARQSVARFAVETTEAPLTAETLIRRVLHDQRGR